ncbi:DUF3095 domain-containing protein [Leptolyngbya sp. FACHB-261]|uniref:DUF3095 domain-containing protein n=1 Tax=Leptolyngbya sp. FACHB-261 TaxID=2692806 RepID=UPI001687689C|nr:DUF3095 domain-containing protein [Leptolyngbya sp. FACHB-261]MBD2102010.1 DUF3095 domain-containing protein [Leptolyngbya sp. FACHB-261]
MATHNFYSELPTLEHFIDITDSTNFVSVPNDWHIIVTDICKSTQAIESGRYKEVNLLGACSVVAVLNIAEEIEIPFVFGGDGATLLVPPVLLDKAQQALLATQELAIKQFGMELRVGIVPIWHLAETPHTVEIAKLKISEHYHQAIFTGGGLTQATNLVKDPNTTGLYKLNSKFVTPKADFGGLECRWQDITSKRGETVSLLVMATTPEVEQADSIYKAVIGKIQQIYGNEESLNPISVDNLNLTFSSQNLSQETRVRSGSSSFLHCQSYLSKIRLENALGSLLMQSKAKFGDINWGLYKKIVTATADYKKFDDMLRMVIAGNATQRKILTAYFEQQRRAGKLVYGLHVSNRALMTCLVFERNGRQVHFVDGADGGYTLAAKAMKQMMEQPEGDLISA